MAHANSGWRTIREFILERDNYTCQDCGHCLMSFALHIHHIKEQWDGGDDSPKNLITLCPQCHRSKHKNTLKNWSKKNHKVRRSL